MTIAEKLASAAVTDSLLREEVPLGLLREDWTQPSWDVQIGNCSPTQGWKVVSAFTEGVDGARLSDAPHLQTLSPGYYVYTLGTISFSAKSTAGRWVSIWAMMAEEEETGYKLKAEVEVETTKWKLFLERATAGEYQKLAEKTGLTFPNAGETEVGRFGLVVGSDGSIRCFYRKGEEAFSELLATEDKTLTSGYGGMAGKGNAMRLRDFSVGTFSLPEEKPGKGLLHPLSRCNPIVNP